MKVEMYTHEWKLIFTFKNVAEAANDLQISVPYAKKCCGSPTKTARNFWLRYAEDVLVGEIWKPHPTITIRCSDKGRIEYGRGIRLCRTFGTSRGISGYRCFKTGGVTYALHRLIAETWIENPLNKPFVNHKDLDKKNNSVLNLEWVTASENSSHYHANKI